MKFSSHCHSYFNEEEQGWQYKGNIRVIKTSRRPSKEESTWTKNQLKRWDDMEATDLSVRPIDRSTKGLWAILVYTAGLSSNTCNELACYVGLSFHKGIQLTYTNGLFSYVGILVVYSVSLFFNFGIHVVFNASISSNANITLLDLAFYQKVINDQILTGQYSSYCT